MPRVTRCSPPRRRGDRLKPVTAPNNAYTSSQTCRACHPSEYKSWHNSYHRTMTQLAKSGAILAKWHGTRLPLGQAALQLEQKRDEFWVNTVGADGIKTDSQRVTMTTGSHHLQMYWTADANGNLQHPFPFGWLIADQKWVPVQDTFLRDPHLAAPDAKWNNVCIKCHAVAGRPGIDARTRTVNTETAELGISCEACHRPAGAHITHYQNPVNRYISHLGDKAVHAILNPGSETLDHRLSAQACGQCHSYQYTPNQLDWLRNGPRFLPGNELKANTTVVHASTFIANGKQPDGHPHPGGEWLGDRFWADGMVRVTGREYNGLLDTACYQRGKMSCLSGHSMHGYLDNNDQLAPRMETNEACLQCHDDFRDNLTAHTHHAADSPGSLCYNCHMPHTTYGLLSGIRSHQIDSPSVETKLKTGRPNACNLCHLDQTLEWSSRHLTKWYDHRQPKLDNDDKTISSVLKMLLKGRRRPTRHRPRTMARAPGAQTSGAPGIATRRHRPTAGQCRRQADQTTRQPPDDPSGMSNQKLTRRERSDQAAQQARTTPAPPAGNSNATPEERRHFKFGWWSLFVFVCLGISLEMMLAFRVGWYMDVDNGHTPVDAPPRPRARHIVVSREHRLRPPRWPGSPCLRQTGSGPPAFSPQPPC